MWWRACPGVGTASGEPATGSRTSSAISCTRSAGTGRIGAPDLLEVGAVHRRRRRDQPRRVDQVARADTVHPHLQVGVAGRERAGRAGVVEVDVRQQQVVEVLDGRAVAGQLGLQRGQVAPLHRSRSAPRRRAGGTRPPSRGRARSDAPGRGESAAWRQHDSGLPYPQAVTVPEDRMATTGEAVVRLLEQYGTDTVFGIPGVHTLEIYRGLGVLLDPPRRAPARAGRGFHGRRVLADRRQAGRVRADHRRGLSNAATPMPGRTTTRSRCS